MGSFIGDVLSPIVGKIQSVIEPLRPLIDFLTTPFPVLDDLGYSVTLLDLAKLYGEGKFDDSFIYAIKDLISLTDKINAFNTSDDGLEIALGDFNLFGDELSFEKGT